MKVKKILLTLGILGANIIGYCSADFTLSGDYYIGDFNEFYPHGNYTYFISNDLNFSTDYGDDNLNAFFWVRNAPRWSTFQTYGWIDGKLYYIQTNSSTSYQGFIDKWCIKSIDSNNDCVYDKSLDDVKALFNVNSASSYSIRTVGSSSPDYYNGGLELCFNDNSNYYCVQCSFFSNSNHCPSGITGSLNFNISQSWESFSSVVYGDSPFVGGNGDGETETGTFIKLPICYTIQQKINSFPNTYNIEMCYSTNKIYSGGQFVNIEQKNIIELRTGVNEFIEDINIYNNYCNNYVTTQTACQQAFEGKEQKRSIINKLNKNNNMYKTYEYCYLQLNYTEEQKNTRTNCTISTGEQTIPGITIEDQIQSIENTDLNIITTTGNNVFNVITEGEDINDIDIIENLQSTYSKITQIFKARNNNNGIIPTYITGILLLILLFKLFKK